MRGIQYIPADTKIPFMRWKYTFLAISLFLVVGSIALFTVKGLNYGIDFKGGMLIEAKSRGPADLARMRSTLTELGLGEVGLQTFGEADTVLVRIEKQPGDDAAQVRALDQVKAALGAEIDYRRVEVVGPQVSSELFTNGMIATGCAILGICLYITFRFEWRFAIGAIAGELHDVITTIGLFALLGMEFNLTLVAALLTIAGYSINDTVVVYDRVRENLRKYKTMPLVNLLDLSLNQTLSRTANTGLTTFLAMLALYLFGGEVMRGFSLAMMWGVVVGTYSSIGTAVPILVFFRLRNVPPAGESAAEPVP